MDEFLKHVKRGETVCG